MMVSVPYWYHLIGINTVRYLQVSIPYWYLSIPQCCQVYSFGCKHMGFWLVVRLYRPMLGRTQNIRLFCITVWLHCQKYGFLLFNFGINNYYYQNFDPTASWLLLGCSNTRLIFFKYVSSVFCFFQVIISNYSWLTKKFNHALVYTIMIVYWQFDTL